MRENDGRKLDHKTLEAMRIRAVQAVEGGESPERVIAALGMSRGIIYRWLSAYQQGGIDALKARRLFGRPPKLTAGQMRWIYRTVAGKNPLQLKFEFALWTREMIREAIKRRFGIALSAVSVGRVLARLGLTCQRPLHRAFQQDEALVKSWMEREFPRIATEAKSAGAEIYFGDEAGVRSDYHSGTTWGLRGVTPVVKHTGTRFGLNMVSAITRRGKLRFMVARGTVNADVFCQFIRRLMHNAHRPVFLIVDGHPTHKSRKVTKLVATYRGRLRLILLPPYSPEVNPDELVWNVVKQKVGKTFLSGPAHLKRVVIGALRELQQTPAKVSALFHEPHVAYANI